MGRTLRGWTLEKERRLWDEWELWSRRVGSPDVGKFVKLLCGFLTKEHTADSIGVKLQELIRRKTKQPAGGAGSEIWRG
jgi:hypothetical protein